MTTNLQVSVSEAPPKEARFPDFELPNHDHEQVRLSCLTQPSLMDKHLGFTDGYPLILIFYRGFFCPRVSEALPKEARQQLQQLVQFQQELAVNY